MSPSTLQDAIQTMQTRVKELEPAVREHTELVQALQKLQGGQTTPKATSRRRGRPKGSTRASQALEQIKADPGITTSELAKRIGVSANYLYRILPKTEGIKKDGKGWKAA